MAALGLNFLSGIKDQVEEKVGSAQGEMLKKNAWFSRETEGPDEGMKGLEPGVQIGKFL